jgi:hypothetical protein
VRLTTFPPVRCTWSRPGYELCSWRFSKRDPAWWTLAPSIGTRHQVNLVCEFPRDGSPAERECDVYPRAAQPFREVVGAAGGTLEQRPARGDAARRTPAWQQLGTARTPLQMSRLIGDAPDRCLPIDARTQLCAWESGKAQWGYELLAAAAEAEGRVLLTCHFPSDGSERAKDACRAEPR